jgi:hypothetical protein
MDNAPPTYHVFKTAPPLQVSAPPPSDGTHNSTPSDHHTTTTEQACYHFVELAFSPALDHIHLAACLGAEATMQQSKWDFIAVEIQRANAGAPQ